MNLKPGSSHYEVYWAQCVPFKYVCCCFGKLQSLCPCSTMSAFSKHNWGRLCSNTGRGSKKSFAVVAQSLRTFGNNRAVKEKYAIKHPTLECFIYFLKLEVFGLVTHFTHASLTKENKTKCFFQFSNRKTLKINACWLDVQLIFDDMMLFYAHCCYSAVQLNQPWT